MRKLRWFSALAMLALTACGGSAGNCSSAFTASCGTGGTTTTVAKLNLLTDLAQVPSDGTKTATITAQALDANNNVMTGVVVVFQASSGALIPKQPTTDASGLALANLGAGSDPSNRTITVTASVGATTATVPVTVNGTTLALSGPPNLVLGNTGSFTVVVTNSAGQGIPGVAVTLASSLGNTLTPAATGTDNNGRLTFTLTATNGGADTITASALGQTQTASLAISTQSFNITAPANGTKVSLGAPQIVTVTWLNNGAPVAGLPVTFAATRGTLTPATPVTTDASGHASVSISSLGAGPSVVDASGTGVSAQLNIDFVADNPSQISVQAGPASINVQGSSTITALVRDAANNLVEGSTVTFQITGDPTNGGLSTATAVTNAQGVAQTVYTAGNSSSGANGVAISAAVNAKGGAPTYTASATLTVGGQTVFLSMGTGNTIIVDAAHPAIYQVPYTVIAVDSNGAPLQNAAITMKVLPVAYGKGGLGGCPSPGPNWTPIYSTAVGDPDSYNGTTMCKNEDTDYTGNIDSLGLNGSGQPLKDYNTSTKLEPGNIAVVSPSSGTTDATGRLDVLVTYPKDHAYWVWETLIASTTVQGTESSASSTFILPGLDADYKCSIGPPGPVSPYGQGLTCADPK
jgi:polyisoprenoid-binding protein YceI